MTNTAEKPMAFATELIQSLLDGSKTNSRMVIKPQPDFADSPVWAYAKTPEEGHSGIGWYCGEEEYPEEGSEFYKCPYKVGDLVRVQEFFPRCGEIEEYRADTNIKIEITNIRVERLQDISEEDAKAEGAMFHDGNGIGHSGWRFSYSSPVWDTAKEAFAELWNTLHVPGSWNLNPWVWVYSFRGVKL